MEGKSFDNLLTVIGVALVELRKAKGYRSHETFAVDFDLGRMHYWRLEKGKCNCTLKTLHKLLDIHGITFEEFFQSLQHVQMKSVAGSRD